MHSTALDVLLTSLICGAFCLWERKECVLKHPLQHGAPLWSAARLAYLVLLALLWAWNLVHLVSDLKSLAEVGFLCSAARLQGSLHRTNVQL